MTHHSSAVDFWLDPACPLTRHTARWITSIADEAAIDVCWRVMSLSVLNENHDDDPEGDPEGYLWMPARVAAAVQTEYGHAELGSFHDALWTDPDGGEREWIGDFAEALRRCGLSPGLAAAAGTSDYDEALRASHHDGVDRIDAEVGTPVLAITTPQGDQRPCFGPVLTAVPAHEDAIRLWEGTLAMTATPHFRELKC
ncbi:mycothiol-dependent nitroreductase Rv2466c family protein [Nocardiopsis nanhaiensis]